MTSGLQVIEIRPRVDWDKGTAVRWIRQVTGSADTLSIYIGDDVTDEDAFAALPEGVTVRVGQAKGTAARYYLDEQKLVQDFLAWLAEAGDRGIDNNPVPLAQVANIPRSQPVG